MIRVQPVGTAEGLPFVGPKGLLVDFASFITDRPVYDNLFETRVLDALRRAGRRAQPPSRSPG